ncbi:MAG: regulatory protein RecX [Bacteroidales bacterium]
MESGADKEGRELYKRALAAMERYSSRRECCRADVERYLSKYNLSVDERAKIIEELTRTNFLDEMRYALAFVRDKSKFNGWGEVKLLWELRKRGISADIIAKALEELPQSQQIDRLRAILQRKLSSLSKIEERQKVKAKLIRLALSKGYSRDLAYRVVKEIMGNFDLNKE